LSLTEGVEMTDQLRCCHSER